MTKLLKLSYTFCISILVCASYFCDVYAEQIESSAKLEDQVIIAKELKCSEFFLGGKVSKLIISGTVEIKNPEEGSFFDPAHDVVISCDYIHFDKGAVLKSPSNLRIIVDKELSGAVRISSSRGIRGIDAPPKPDQYVGKPAANGLNGQPGQNGKNASDLGSDGTDGQDGANATHGRDGSNGERGDGGGRGADGSKIWLTVKSLAEDTTISIASVGGEGGAGGRGAPGQDGGNGGVGGYGGKGGDASYTHTAENGGNGGDGGDGGNGGNGGSGGKGGNGGKGGDLAFYIVQGGRLPSEAFNWTNSGGRGGWPGIGGPGGRGGAGGDGGAAGCGGNSQEWDPLQTATLGLSTVIIKDGEEITVHVSGKGGSWGKQGKDGKDGAPGVLGSWGDEGEEGHKGNLFQGVVTLKDFESYKQRTTTN